MAHRKPSPKWFDASERAMRFDARDATLHSSSPSMRKPLAGTTFMKESTVRRTSDT